MISSFRNSGRYWSGNLNVRHNQDNQRDFEERAAAQMKALLTKRTAMENLLSKFNKKQHGCKTKQPIGMFLMQYYVLYIKVNKKTPKYLNNMHLKQVERM